MGVIQIKVQDKLTIKLLKDFQEINFIQTNTKALKQLLTERYFMEKELNRVKYELKVNSLKLKAKKGF